MNHRVVLVLACFVATDLARSQDLMDIEEEPPAAPPIVELIDSVTPDGGARQSLAKSLASVGSSAVPVLFAALGPASPLRDDVRCEVEQALKLIGPAVVHGHVLSRIADEPDLEIRMRSLRVVGVVGGRGAWSVVQKILTDVHEHTLRSATVSGSIRIAVARAVASDPDAPAAISRCWSDLHDSWRPSILRALSEAGTGRATALLVRLADCDEQHRAAALAALAKVPLLAINRLDPMSWRRLRNRLESEDANVRRLAAAIVARGHDVDAFHELVVLLEDEDMLVRRGALQALRKMTGFRASADVVRWRWWYEQERGWRYDDIDDSVGLLESEDPRMVSGALGSLAQHRLFRAAFLADVHDVLGHKDAAVREIACRSLAALGSPASAGALLLLMDDPDERVRGAAHAALRAVTGLRHGPDRTVWRSALRTR